MKVIGFTFFMMLACHSYASVTYGQDFTSIGISSFIYQTPYETSDNDHSINTSWSPFIAAQYNNFFIRDVEIGYQFLTTYDYGAALSLSGDHLNQQRKGKVAGSTLKSIKDGLNLKGSFSLYRQSGIYSLTAMQDISDVHAGKESTLSWLYTVRTSRRGLNLTWYPSIYASWMDEKLVEHYFNTQRNRSAWRYGMGVTLDYHPAEHWLIQTVIENEHYSSEITHSPAVERSNVWFLTFNLGYYF